MSKIGSLCEIGKIGDIKGLPEQLLRDIEDIHEELVQAYVGIIEECAWEIKHSPTSQLFKYSKKYEGWYNTCFSNLSRNAGEKLVKLGLWEKCEGKHHLYRPIKEIQVGDKVGGNR